jgi:imidazolonepropionase-like amidohydrolase
MGGLVHGRADGWAPTTISIKGDRIAGLNEGGGSGRTINVSGLYLLPGMIDCHVHLVMRGEDADPSANASRSDAEIAAYAAEAASRTLLAGFTSVRDVGGWNHLEMELRTAIERGDRIGPRLFLAGRLLSMPTEAVAYYPGMYEVASGPRDVRAAAIRQLDRGADVVKVMATGSMLSPEGEDAGATQFGPEELRTVVEAARSYGKPVAAHAHAAQGIRAAVDAGVASIEHGTYADQAVLGMMAQRGVFLVPTLCTATSLFRNQEIVRAMPSHLRERLADSAATHVAAMRLARRLGVPIAMGTDAGTPGNHHGRNAEECVAMVQEMGMTPEEAILAATADAARLLWHDRDVGALEPGHFADVIGLRADPFGDPTELTRVAFVMKGGIVFKDER